MINSRVCLRESFRYSHPECSIYGASIILLKKEAAEKFHNDELINIFSRLVVEMDCERIRKKSVSVSTRIGIHNTAFYGKLMMGGSYEHENVM